MKLLSLEERGRKSNSNREQINESWKLRARWRESEKEPLLHIVCWSQPELLVAAPWVAVEDRACVHTHTSPLNEWGMLAGLNLVASTNIHWFRQLFWCGGHTQRQDDRQTITHTHTPKKTGVCVGRKFVQLAYSMCMFLYMWILHKKEKTISMSNKLELGWMYTCILYMCI